MNPRKVKLIVNPESNHGETRDMIEPIRAFLTPRLNVDLEVTTAPYQAVDIAQDLDGYDIVVAVGGDGTTFEIVNGLMKNKKCRPSLGIIPLGSGNDLRRALCISKNMEKAMETIVSGRLKRMDLGKANNLYFTNSLAIGFDARVAHLVNQIKTASDKTGLTLYLYALSQIVLHDYYSHRIRIKIDSADWVEQEMLLIAINNGVSYGGGFKITPNARNDDGLLEICLVDNLPRWQIPLRLPFVLAGKHQWMKPAHFYQAKSVIIESDKDLPAALDGELILAKRFKVDIIPQVLQVIIPD